MDALGGLCHAERSDALDRRQGFLDGFVRAEQNGYRIRCLATFAPPDRGFLAHPLGFIEMQAEALALPHHVLLVTPPFESGYEAGLRRLRDEMGVDCVVTGDIAEVAGNPNWIRERSRRVGMDVYTPLWGRDRRTLLQQLLERGFKARVSCVDTRWLHEDWVGRELDVATVAELQAIHAQTGLDPCGEEGEYHTLVIDGPSFTRAIDIRSHAIRAMDLLAYMEIHGLEWSGHAI